MPFNPNYPAPIVQEPASQPANACVIWLHGLGADGHDFEGIVPQLNLPADHGIRFVFPTAGKMAVTVNMGMEMNSWYDIRSIHLLQDTDWDGITQSVAYVNQLIEQQIQQGIAADKILLAGFSQGGLIVQQAALRYAEPLAGVMALSTYLPIPDEDDWVKQPTTCPWMIAHGTMDPICPLQGAEAARASLTSLGFAPQWFTYPMQHQVCGEEVEQMSAFIQMCLLAEK